MRVVLWNSQERVDLPDMQASETLHLGEHRRIVRGLLIGPNGASFDNFLVRGFKVEPSSPASAIVHVKLDPGGSNPKSFAIGKDPDFSGAYGAVIGGNDDQANLEGNADLTLNFTGQPNGTYTVYMKFSFADGTNDNRAQRNPTLNTESIVAMNTRRLPAVSLHLTASPAEDYIPLASVVWGGSTINAGNITDVRSFVFEGESPFYQTTKSGTGGMADFSRSALRGDNGVNEVYPVLRALARQIQDIKGQADDGNLSWWARPAKPWDPDALLSGADYSRSMRSLETVTFTVGDGVNFFGDFNGATGLDDCLTHLENCTSLPDRIEILLRGVSMGASFNLGAHDLSAFNSVHLAIIGQGGAASSYGRSGILATTTDGTTMLKMGATLCTVEMANVSIYGAANASGGQQIATAHRFIGRNCEFIQGMHTAAASTSVDAVQCSQLLLHDCRGVGRWRINGTSKITHCQLSNAAIYTAANTANNVTISDCEFNSCIAMSGLDSVLHIVGRDTLISNNRFAVASTNGSVNGIKIGYAGVGTDPFNQRIVGNSFSWGRQTHTTDAGPNTTDGSGWAIYAKDDVSHVVIAGNQFTGQGAQTHGVVDSGAIGVFGGDTFSILNNTFTNWQPITSVATARCALIRLGTANIGGSMIAGNVMNSWGDHASVHANAECACIWTSTTVSAMRISNNVMGGRNAAGTTITAFAIYGLYLSFGSTVLRWLAQNNYFTGFESTAIYFVTFPTHWNIAHNTFYRCGNAIQGIIDYSVISGNIFSESSSIADNGIDILGDYTTIVGNVLDVPVGNDGITNNSTLTAFVGNVGTGDIDGAIGAVGYNYAADLNIANAYI